MPNFSLFARLFIVILVVAATFAADPAQAQPWSGIIDPSRAMNWSNAGVPGGIPTNRTQCGSTIAPTNDASIINNALNACGANQFVKLGAGTFILNSGVNVTKNNTTLRGSGPDQTKLVFQGSYGCIGWLSQIGLGACNNNEWLGTTDEVLDGVSWATTWTGTTEGGNGSYPIGATHLIVGSTANMAAGRIVQLDQLGETADDGGLVQSLYSPTFRNDDASSGMWRKDSADGTCSPDPAGHCFRAQIQFVKIVSVDDATHITITPGLELPNWRSAMKPAVAGWGRTDASTAFGIGLEDLTIENQYSGAMYAVILFGDCYGCWMKNVRSLNAQRSHVQIKQSAHIEIRDSYLYGSLGTNSQSYGIEPWTASDSLFINNITHSTTAAYLGPCQGCVYAYNYNWGSVYTDFGNCIDQGGRNSPCVWPVIFSHDAGGGMALVEGNEISAVYPDLAHGNAPLYTEFRNYLSGNDDQGSKSYGRIPVHIDATSRANNIVGNVLGDPNVSAIYQVPFGQNSYFTTQAAIYQLGVGGGSPNDSVVASSLLRWGNYDTVNDSVQWNASEIPTTGIRSINGNPVPSNHILLNSFFLASQPTTFWTTPWGTPPWPPIGPDVTGGDAALGGHVYDIPAKLCFNHLTNDPAYPTSAPRIKLYNSTNCYKSSGSSVTTAPIVTLTIQ